jgi:hypothetical protein
MRLSAFGEAAEDFVLTDGLGALLEVRNRNGKVILDTPHLGRDGLDCTAGLLVQIHHEDRNA